MALPTITKPTQIPVPLADWKALRILAARRKQPMTVVLAELLPPVLQQIREMAAEALADDDE